MIQDFRQIIYINIYKFLILITYQWLETVFLGYLDEWEAAVSSRTDLSAKDEEKSMLSRETLEGLRIAG